MSALPPATVGQVKPLAVLKFDFLGKRVPQTPRRPEPRQPLTPLERAIVDFLERLPASRA